MQVETNLEEVEHHLFTNTDLLQYRDASTGQRFLNLLIDSLFMQYAIGYFSGYLLAKIIFELSPDLAYQLFADDATLNFFLVSYILSIFNYLVYYTFCEKVFKGYTLGKLITGTRAIRADQTELTLKDTFLRSLVRLIPFEPFSAFGGEPWHDRWTKTMVIKSR